jgi:hypothetical protein
MKREFTSIFLLVCLLFLAVSAAVASGQTIGAPATVTGVTNAPMFIYGVIPTNFGGYSLPGKTLTVYNVTSNETIIGSYGIIVNGTTNFIPLASFTNTFNAPLASWTTNIQVPSVQFSWYPVVQINVGTNINGVQVVP